MALSPGTRLGPYEVLSAIGAGGMGEVYRARDTKLNRDVALKVLPTDPDRLARADRLARFQREAQVLAALNHPNIAHIHGLEDAGPVPALIMELVEGPTLAEFLRATGQRPRAQDKGASQGPGPGALDLADALAIARQIADALETAHSQHIVHRDLKPANIKLKDVWGPGLRQGFGQARRSAEGAEAATPARFSDGRLAPARAATDVGGCTVKVLDFGIAKVLASAVSHHDADDATLTALDTQAGVVIGTPAYMSPEQARGAAVDERTDIWAFGCVLYEMITGRRPFPGTATAEVIAAVIEREPDWTAVSNAPPAIRRLLRRCLQKDPRRRLRDIGDARLEIDEAEAGDETRPVARDPRKARRPWLWITAGLMAALVLAAGAWFGYRWMFLTSTPARPDFVFQRITDAVGLEDSPAISPDGKSIAYVALTRGRQQIWVRLLTGGRHIQITDADLDHEQPRWAADSNSILYFTRSETEEPQGTLWEVLALGGQPRPIANALGGGDISHNGHRIAAFQLVDNTIRLRILRRDGTLEREWMQLPPGPRARTPRWAPDDRTVAYLELRSGAFSHALKVASTTGDEPKVLAEGPVIDGLAWIPDGSGLVFGSAKGSTILYPPTFQLRLVRLGGDSEQLTFGAESYTHPDVHAESGLLLATRTQLRSALSKVPTTDAPTANAQGAIALTHGTSQVQAPSASQDGKRIIYLSDSGGHGNLWRTDADGRERVQITQVRDPAVSIGVPVLSPDGSQIANVRRSVEVANEQWLLNSDGFRERRLLANGSGAWWSLDGDWLYYHIRRDRAGEFCIEKLRVADPNARGEQIRCGDVVAPMPHPDGSLFFQRQFMAFNGGFNYEIQRASSDRGEATPLLKIDGRRLPYDSHFAAPTAFSPDGKWLAFVMMDGNTANLWRLPTTGGKAQKITEFGSRALWIVRQIAWPDGNFIYAAIADLDADVVSISGLVAARGK